MEATAAPTSTVRCGARSPTTTATATAPTATARAPISKASTWTTRCVCSSATRRRAARRPARLAAPGSGGGGGAAAGAGDGRRRHLLGGVRVHAPRVFLLPSRRRAEPRRLRHPLSDALLPLYAIGGAARRLAPPRAPRHRRRPRGRSSLPHPRPGQLGDPAARLPRCAGVARAAAHRRRRRGRCSPQGAANEDGTEQASPRPRV